MKRRAVLKFRLAGVLLAALLCAAAGMHPALAQQSPAESPAPGGEAVAAEESPSVKMAQSGAFSLYADPNSGVFTVKNSESGTAWHSIPENLERDTLAKGKNKVNLQSLLLLHYYDPADNIIDSVGSYSGAVQRKGVKVSAIPDGIRIEYDFSGIQIRLAMEVVLKKSSVQVTIPTQSIEEYGPNYLSAVALLPNMDAGFESDEGWIFVPDGSGATARFGNGRGGTAAYEADVYGRDANQSLVRKIELTQSVRLPVFGIKHADRAFLAIITQGDGNAVLGASVSGMQNLFGAAGATFRLRRSDQYDMGQSTGQSRTVNLFSTVALTKTPIQVEYHLLEGDAASLSGMARVCREFYRNEDRAKADLSGDVPMLIDLLGAVYKKVPVMGIPVRSVLPVTTFDDAAGILGRLRKSGVERTAVRYTGWSTDQIKGKIGDSASAAGKLGGTRGLRKLLGQDGTELYLSSEFTYVGSWQLGYGRSQYAAKSIKNVPTVLYEHNIATFFADKRFPGKWLLSTRRLEPIGAKYLKSFQKLGHNFLDMGSTGAVLYSDFSQSAHTRDDSKADIAALYRRYSEAGLRLSVSGGNAYAAVYADYLPDAPAASSRFDMLDETVPFYQMVFHGGKYLGSEAINLAADSKTAFLRAVQTGSLLSYSFIGPDGRGHLADTVYEGLYSADLSWWLKEASGHYRELQPYYERILPLAITDFRYLSEDVTLTVYEDGTEAVVNFGASPFEYRGETVSPRDYRFEFPR